MALVRSLRRYALQSINTPACNLMRVTHHQGRKRITIDPGEHYVDKTPVIISTLLGSCVAACIWDERNGVFGMNHFLLAQQRYSTQTSTLSSDAGRYGIHSMEILINSMLKAGASRSQLRAKAFGGANVLRGFKASPSVFPIGDVNSRFIIEFLENENIPLVASNLGGEHGRIIHFDGIDYSVYMKRIATQASERGIAEQEEQLRKRQLQKQAQEERDKQNNIAIW